MTLVVLASVAVAAECGSVTTAADLDARLTSADTAYGMLDVEVFTSSSDEAQLMLPCMGAPIPASVAAHYLRVLGIRYFIERDSAHADLVFAGARAIDPGFVFSEATVPPSHSIRVHYVAMDLSSLASEPLAPARTGAVWINGAVATSRPGVPSIVQVTDAEGAVRSTTVVFPGDSFPAYDASNVVATRTGAPRPMNPGVPFVIGAGVAAAGSVALFVLSTRAEADFQAEHEGDSLAELSARRDLTNGLAYGSIGAGVLALAGGVGAVVSWRW